MHSVTLPTLLLLTFVTTPFVTASMKKMWNPQFNHNDIDQWTQKGSNKNCAQKFLNYPKEVGVYTIPKLPSTADELHRILLPKFGAILFPVNGVTKFSPSKCNPNDNYLMVDITYDAWLMPDNWKTLNQEPNSAIPHMFQLPCDCDTVIFPSNQSLSISLQQTDLISNFKVQFGDRKVEHFNDVFQSGIGSHIFYADNNFIISTKSCLDEMSCLCHTGDFWAMDSAIYLTYDHHEGHCPDDHCEHKVYLEGHSCPLCAAEMLVPVNGGRCPAMPIVTPPYDLDVYVGVIKKSTRIFIQIVVAEKEEYTGVSSVKYAMNLKEQHYPDRKDIIFSHGGRGYSVHGWAYTTVLLGFLIVSIAILSVFAVYERDFVDGRIRPALIRLGLASPIVFARFDYHGGSPLVNEEHDSEVHDNPNFKIEFHKDQRNTGFNNPLFKKNSNEGTSTSEIPIQNVSGVEVHEEPLQMEPLTLVDVDL